ncbi:STAS domain-containing protein [Natronospora cellulosivora (SeqCode)]
MDITVKIMGNILIARLDGELDISTVPVFKEKIVKPLEEGDISYLLLNLKKVNFIDSSGLGVILGRYRYLDKIGGKILLVDLKEQVRKIFTMAGMLKIMKEYGNEKEAMEEVQEGRIA